MGQFNDISIKDVIEEINVSYFLPDIQREYVWLDRAQDRKIEQLFDSILRDYPIGSFLFWKLKTTDVETDRNANADSDKLNFQLYEFMEDYDVRKPHNNKIEINRINSNSLNIVLDGQQRLTSLYIGLKGSRTLKKPKGWWDNPNAFEKKILYLNLRYKPNEDDTEDCYQFEFKNPASLPENDEENYWFRVGDILEIDSLNRYCREHQLDDDSADTLELLKNTICNQRIISYYEENDKDLNKVLKIFIRVNSGGTKLSYSDLLMSILTANFSSDIREVMNTFVDNIKAEGFGCFGRDQVLKTCLLLIGIKHKFVLKNFCKLNIENIEKCWPKITEAITDAVHIVKDFGYSGMLSSGYIISTIALYLGRKSISYNDMVRNVEELNEVGKFIRTSQITSYFTTSLDSKLSYVVEEMAKADSFAEFNEGMHARRLLNITMDDIEGIMEMQYSNTSILPILQVLYPNLDYKNRLFHIDHIYPKSKFNHNNRELNPDYIGTQNYIFNLQLLQGQENIMKKDKNPEEWLAHYFDKDAERIKAYKKENYIDEDFALDWNDFGKFKEMRYNSIKNALIKYFIED